MAQRFRTKPDSPNEVPLEQSPWFQAALDHLEEYHPQTLVRLLDRPGHLLHHLRTQANLAMSAFCQNKVRDDIAPGGAEELAMEVAAPPESLPDLDNPQQPLKACPTRHGYSAVGQAGAECVS